MARAEAVGARRVRPWHVGWIVWAGAGLACLIGCPLLWARYRDVGVLASFAALCIVVVLLAIAVYDFWVVWPAFRRGHLAELPRQRVPPWLSRFAPAMLPAALGVGLLLGHWLWR